MPVEFLSDAEAAAYCRFDGDLSRDDLDRVLFLDDADLELIEKRRVRGGAVSELMWLVGRRSRCRGCEKTHVVLADVCLARRRDATAVIGAALVARAAGATQEAIAAELELPATTVRGWLRRAEERAEPLRAHFTRVEALLPARSARVDGAGGRRREVSGARA